jgi:hypothetical protein
MCAVLLWSTVLSVIEDTPVEEFLHSELCFYIQLQLTIMFQIKVVGVHLNYN